MVKRKESDSGLRAGFIREDDAKRLSQQSPAPVENNGEAAETSVIHPLGDEVGNAPSSSDTKGPKVSMQGVSGKMITGIIQAVKRKPKAALQDESGAVWDEAKAAPLAREMPATAGEATAAAPSGRELNARADGWSAAEDLPIVGHGGETRQPLSDETPRTETVRPPHEEKIPPVAAAEVVVQTEERELPCVGVEKLSPVQDARLPEAETRPAAEAATAPSAPMATAPPASSQAERSVSEDASQKEAEAGETTEHARAASTARAELKTESTHSAPTETTQPPPLRSAMTSAAHEPHSTAARPAQSARPRPASETGSRQSAAAPAETAAHDRRQSAASPQRTGEHSSATATKPSDSRRAEVKVDQGITSSYAQRQASSGRTPIRPQKGNYVGKDSQVPAFRNDQQRGQSGSYSSTRPPYRDGRTSEGRPQGQGGYGSRPQGGGYSQRPQGGYSPRPQGGYSPRPQGGGYSPRPQGGYSPRPQGGGAPGQGGFNRDKDSDDAPRRTRSPKPQKRDGRAPAAPPIADPLAVRKQDNRRAFSKDKNDGNRHDLEGKAGRGRADMATLGLDEETLRRGRRRKERRQDAPQQQRAVLSLVKLPSSMTVKELAEFLKKTSAEVISKLIPFGVMATVNQEIDYDTADVIAQEFGIKTELLVAVTEEQILFDESEDAEEELVARPPVVVVMGHVDHGKTSILDWIRNSKVAAREAGGITQHIGAYMVDVNGKKITFLDTPGHEAFTTMRARGAQVTDIAILVVAADDGVMPQTIEAINHARAAHTEIIVAINKIDKAGINMDRVKQELATQNLMAPDWGGNVTMVPVSAKTGENMDELLDMILLTAEMLELKANPKRQAKGTVIEARLDKNRGPVATVLVQRGTLRLGDTVVVGTTIGNIRAMSDDRGESIEVAGPSVPVEILGLPAVLDDGEIFYEVENERVARSLIDRRREEEREKQLKKSSKLSLDNLFDRMAEGEAKDLNLIIKGDVVGSVEAITQSLEKLSNDEVRIHVIHGAVGAITESDVHLADVSDAIIIGFNVRPATTAREMAADKNVDIRLYRVIYNAIEDIEKAMKGMLAPTFEEEILGHATVREIYKVSGVGTIAGSYVTDGKIQRNASVRILRDGVVVHEGELASLKRFKDDAREVATGYECGIGIARYNDIKLGDQFEMYRMKEVSRD